MRVRSLVPAAAALVIVLAVAFAAFHATTGRSSRAHALPVIADLGGDFELLRAGGKRVRLQDYRGRVVLLFFGYTYCPDVCPASLYTLKVAMDDLGQAADQVQAIMITVDAERDSPEHLQQYVHYFHPQFLGLGGTTDEIEKAARQYHVYHEKGKSLPGGGYVVNHSAYLYLLDKQGKVRALFGAGAKPGDVADSVWQLLQEATAGN